MAISTFLSDADTGRETLLTPMCMEDRGQTCRTRTRDDAVLARRETEEGTESNDLLLQQAETEKRQTDGRNAEESKGRREQAHGPSVSPERLSPLSRTPPAEAKWGRTSAPFSY